MTPYEFSQRLLAWFDQHGRKDLPWQQNITPYRVWVSEIMLQQTRVATVIPYFQRFMHQFPTVQALADANEDAVLHLWSGLGYYSRARNLHQAAKLIVTQFNGELPCDIQTLMTLPGIGRSTAGAILAIAWHQPVPILDGNVKRVLTRFYALAGWPGKQTVTNQLWEKAELLTPIQRVSDYTQAIMDLGATICTRHQPQCTQCPLHTGCQAYAQQKVQDYPTPKPKRTLPTRTIRVLVLLNSHQEILLEKRPPTGVWGGLWSLPECPIDADIASWCLRYFGCRILHTAARPSFEHTFSHFTLHITPVIAQVASKNCIMENTNQLWYKLRGNKKAPLGLAAPIQRLLTQLQREILYGT